MRIPGSRRCDRTGFCIIQSIQEKCGAWETRTVIVRKGLGTHTIHIRLFNPAEVVVLNLNNC